MSDTKIDLTEEVNLILEGTEATDEFKTKLATVLEATIQDKVKTISENLDAENVVKLAAAKDEMIDTLEEANQDYENTLEENVSKYLEYVINEWMEENELAIEAGIKVERAENFMEGLQDLFSENFVEVPESGEDVIAISESKISEMEAKLHEQMTKITELEESQDVLVKANIIESHSEGLTETEIEKLTSLTEDVAYTNADTFSSKVLLIKEAYFKEASDEASTKELTETVKPVSIMSALEKDRSDENPMNKYLSAFR